MRFTRRYRFATVLVGSVACALVVAGCGGDDVASAGPSKVERAVTRAARRAPVMPGPATVVAEDNVFEPEVIKVHAGADVMFTNNGRNLHNVIPINGGGYRIDTDALRPDMSKTVRIAEPGTYRYYCSIHGTETRGMIGAIAVVR